MNTWNDDFYAQWRHQLYFSLTEAVSTVAIVTMCDRHRPVRTYPVLVIFVIGVFHIFAGSWDQVSAFLLHRQLQANYVLPYYPSMTK